VPVPPISRLCRCVQRTALENWIIILVPLAVTIVGLRPIFFSHWRGYRRLRWTVRGNWSLVLRRWQGLLFTVRGGRLLLGRSCHRCARPGCWHPAHAKMTYLTYYQGSGSVLDPDSMRSVDPNLNPLSESGSGSRRSKMTHKSRKNLEISCFEVKYVLFWELKASSVTWTSFVEALG
jgi:hypothetical protein